ncbi:MAG: response regulator [Candidatus Omnitrophica bacterium]|nr:response regulator [Candidatus Omnitrophota bacterium]
MILIVEGDLSYGQRLRDSIHQLGEEVHLVLDGLEALRWLRNFLPKLIVVDQTAPWIDGFRLCRLIKFHKRQQQVPVLLMGMVTDEEHRRLANAVKADGYVEKQEDLGPVMQWVRGWLAGGGK